MAGHVPPRLPYRWYPQGTRNKDRPATGALVAWRHKVWRVVESGPVPEIDWSDEDRAYLERWGGNRASVVPWITVIRPLEITGDDPRARDYDVHLRTRPGRTAGFEVYPDEHYPVCARCAEPLPCREQMIAEVTAKAAKHAACYSLPGVCPACQEPVTGRQKTITFEDNLYVPCGPPVTFHVGRHECRYSAAEYEKNWAAADPGHRTVTLTCPGHMQQHLDGRECSEGEGCRGEVRHKSWTQCWPAAAGSGSCQHCADVYARRQETIRARNAAGDWTTWPTR